MSTRIQEAVTFIKATREEAITLAHDVGDAEVHALHIQNGFSAPAQQPVGYMVVPVKRWVGLTAEESVSLLVKANKPKRGQQFTTAPEMAAEFGRLVSELLKERNT
ncbi:MAG: hypothetical protein EB114_11095 [Betaproteobacteria bacterium]|nr:hypothetical protein [Betaproteobacteria bacterium]